MACRDVWNTWPSGLRSPQNPPASPSGFVVTGGPRAMYFTHHGKPWLKPITKQRRLSLARCKPRISPAFAYLDRAGSRFAPSQWETALLYNDVSHWLGASLESALPQSSAQIILRCYNRQKFHDSTCCHHTCKFVAWLDNYFACQRSMYLAWFRLWVICGTGPSEHDTMKSMFNTVHWSMHWFRVISADNSVGTRASAAATLTNTSSCFQAFPVINTLRPWKNGHHFADDIFFN